MTRADWLLLLLILALAALLVPLVAGLEARVPVARGLVLEVKR